MTAPPALLVLSGVLGLAIGSFLNVVIHRLPLGQSLVTPPSTCPSCRTRLRWIDNIQV
ncbi:MAG: prepilin peptidase, partial [Vicinamibacterales bacterium]